MTVQVNYLGRLGNNMFQYAYGRLLAEHLGYSLTARPIPYFPKTYEIVTGTRVDQPEVVIKDWDEFDGVYFQFKDMEKHKGSKITLNGFFQHMSYFKNHKEKLREWFAIPKIPVASDLTDRDVVIHIRLTDYQQIGWTLPFSFFEESLSRIPNLDRVFICTDEPMHPFLENFKSKNYNLQIRTRTSEIEDFMFMVNAKNIVISRSTYSWWAAFLSNAERIYYPLPSDSFWSLKDTPYKDIRVMDEPRYIYLDC